jgi:quinol monooxygenase YgiN
MPIQTIATYRVKPSGVDKVRQAIADFVVHVRANEPGTHLYVAWQQQDDPTRFTHFFIFADEAAHAAHAGSAAVKRFEAAYRPELIEGDVVFTDFEPVAAI